VILTGVWDHDHRILLGPKSYETHKGYQVIVPLIRPNGGSTVFVNRGFVSSDVIKNHAELLVKEKGTVEVRGLLRCSQERNTFTPENKPEEGKWYWVDVEAMAMAAGGPDAGLQPVYIEAVFGETESGL
jgi:surfeit locus 1 family protein